LSHGAPCWRDSPWFRLRAIAAQQRPQKFGA
jgi:hypothetical protein